MKAVFTSMAPLCPNIRHLVVAVDSPPRERDELIKTEHGRRKRTVTLQPRMSACVREDCTMLNGYKNVCTWNFGIT